MNPKGMPTRVAGLSTTARVHRVIGTGTLLACLLGAQHVSAHPNAPPPAAGDLPRAPDRADDKPIPAAEAQRRSQVAASFEGGAVTLGELEDAILAQNPFMQERYVSMDAVRALLDRSVRFALLAEEAERRGYGKTDAVVLAQQQSAVQKLLAEDFDDKLTPDSISEADVKQYYSQHIDEFVRGEGRRVSQLVVADEAAASALLAQAQAADLRGFRELARAHSLDETTKQRGGDLPYFDAAGRGFDETDTRVDEALAKAAFALRHVGETSQPIRVGDRYVILRLSGIRPAQDESIAQAQERIRLRLWRERRQAAIDAHIAELKQQKQVTVHRELIDAVKLDDGPPLPPSDGLPSGFPHTPAVVPQKPHRDESEAR